MCQGYRPSPSLFQPISSAIRASISRPAGILSMSNSLVGSPYSSRHQIGRGTGSRSLGFIAYPKIGFSTWGMVNLAITFDTQMPRLPAQEFLAGVTPGSRWLAAFAGHWHSGSICPCSSIRLSQAKHVSQSWYGQLPVCNDLPFIGCLLPQTAQQPSLISPLSTSF
ncbi:hypothetical protein LCGC14_2363360 [marine sediment metagenome]|uniref:Uncharacterized protein n=1 Tax=marine sediment metagenome TaxID=412755 RepID=A0A0F9EID8_9ZZZZ